MAPGPAVTHSPKDMAFPRRADTTGLARGRRVPNTRVRLDRAWNDETSRLGPVRHIWGEELTAGQKTQGQHSFVERAKSGASDVRKTKGGTTNDSLPTTVQKDMRPDRLTSMRDASKRPAAERSFKVNTTRKRIVATEGVGASR